MTNYITKTIKNGVEANIPVTSVNGQYGDVVVAGKEYTAGEGIVIGTIHSDMQGPAPDGFHIPTKDELILIKDIWTNLGGSGLNNFCTALKVPTAGKYNSQGSIVNRDSSPNVVLWSSTSSNENFAYRLVHNSLNFNVSSDNKTYGCSIRPFKNNPVVPTSSWTKLYGTSIEAGGIFWSATDGLISLSSDGTTWITIADKNLGATQVWNSGDTLLEANCGKYYQRGNNYGFPFSGSITTSSTQVDASNYGPGNYYNSSTFITRSSIPRNWDTSNNDNLWGGVTQGTWVSDDGNTITNTGVLSVNGQTGNVTNVVINDSAGPKSIVKIRGGTQAEYDALTTKDSNTLYFTTE